MISSPITKENNSLTTETLKINPQNGKPQNYYLPQPPNAEIYSLLDFAHILNSKCNLYEGGTKSTGRSSLLEPSLSHFQDLQKNQNQSQDWYNTESPHYKVYRKELLSKYPLDICSFENNTLCSSSFCFESVQEQKFLWYYSRILYPFT